MTHDPVEVTVAWLRAFGGLSSLATNPERIAATLGADVPRPALYIPNATGAPLADASGLDHIYDWVVTVYAVAGRYGRGNDYPDHPGAMAVARQVVAACRQVADGAAWPDPASGATLLGAEVISLTRDTDAGGNGLVTMTLDVRIAE